MRISDWSSDVCSSDLIGVATVWLGLADHLDETSGEVPSLERIMLGGSPVPQALMDRLERRLGVTVQTSWGMTELSPLGTVTPPKEPVRRSSQAGRPPNGEIGRESRSEKVCQTR